MTSPCECTETDPWPRASTAWRPPPHHRGGCCRKRSCLAPGRRPETTAPRRRSCRAEGEQRPSRREAGHGPCGRTFGRGAGKGAAHVWKPLRAGRCGREASSAPAGRRELLSDKRRHRACSSSCEQGRVAVTHCGVACVAPLSVERMMPSTLETCCAPSATLAASVVLLTSWLGVQYSRARMNEAMELLGLPMSAKCLATAVCASCGRTTGATTAPPPHPKHQQVNSAVAY